MTDFFNPPAMIDDLAALPALRQQFMDRWNEQVMGNFVDQAANRSPNYVDPRVNPPNGAPVKVPWNGFPRLLSRWYDDEQSTALKQQAERTACASPQANMRSRS